MFLIGYLISRENMYEELCEFMGGSLSSESPPCHVL